MDDYIVFGNENAEHDDLLMECHVNHVPGARKIITGRWGAGKTAYIFWNNRNLTSQLCQVNKKYQHIWYLDEDDLNSDQLIEAYLEYEDRRFERYLCKIWKSEIYRRAINILSYLMPHYQYVHGFHWDYISSLASKNEIKRTIWEQIPNALKVLRLIDEKNDDALENLQGSFHDLFSDKTEEFVQDCLEDIDGHECQPVIAIEPVETSGSYSTIEKEPSLAQSVITSLVNVFRADFQPSNTKRQRLFVMLSIPWHRYSNLKLSLPQKTRQYVLHLKWEKEQLYDFINKRIAYEFNRVGRKTSLQIDLWKQLFSENISNKYISPHIIENSFDYVLRHTHYRPRDIQRIVKKAVELCSIATGLGIDEVISGVHGIKVDENHLKDAVADCNREFMADFIDEMSRKNHENETYFHLLSGLSSPFTTKDLTNRFKDLLVEEKKFSRILDDLFLSGFIGIEIMLKQEREKEIEKHKHIMDSKKYIRRTNYHNRVFHCWYFFEYNTKSGFNEVVNKYKDNPDLEMSFIFHPKTYEALAANVSTKRVFGI